MNSLKHLRSRFIVSAAVATALGASIGTALAGDAFLPVLEQGSPGSSQMAYNSERYPVYQKVHRAPEREKTEFARLEERSEADSAKAEEKQQSRGYHRRAPYGARMQY